jgi:type I restriction enzyme M protein
MLTGELRSQVDAIWNAFWSGGISNPMEVLEQITYLLFIRRLDDAHTLEENKALTLGKPISNRVFPAGKDEKGRDYQDLRWSRFKNFAPAEMHKVVGEHVFPFLRQLGGSRDASTGAPPCARCGRTPRYSTLGTYGLWSCDRLVVSCPH